MATNTVIRTVGEAPIDGNLYGRIDGIWQSFDASSLGNFEATGNTITNIGDSLSFTIIDVSNADSTIDIATEHDTVNIGAATGNKVLNLNSQIIQAPALTNSLIDSASGTSVITKQWAEANFSDSALEEAPTDGKPYVRQSSDWAEPVIEISGQSATAISLNHASGSVANAVTIPAATTSLAGIMTASDKTNLDANTDKVSVPSGGLTGEVLAKVSDTDYDLEWTSAGTGIEDVTYTPIEGFVRIQGEWRRPKLVEQLVTSTGITLSVGSTSGSGALVPYIFPAATTTTAGLMTAADKTNVATNTDKVGIIAGGTAGQVLSKVNSTDYNVEWVDGAAVSDTDVSLSSDSYIYLDVDSGDMQSDFNSKADAAFDTLQSSIISVASSIGKASPIWGYGYCSSTGSISFQNTSGSTVTATNPGTGVLIFTHDVGHTNYIVNVQAFGQYNAYVVARSSTSFTINTTNPAGTNTSAAVMYTIISFS